MKLDAERPRITPEEIEENYNEFKAQELKVAQQERESITVTAGKGQTTAVVV